MDLTRFSNIGSRVSIEDVSEEPALSLDSSIPLTASNLYMESNAREQDMLERPNHASSPSMLELIKLAVGNHMTPSRTEELRGDELDAPGINELIQIEEFCDGVFTRGRYVGHWALVEPSQRSHPGNDVSTQTEIAHLLHVFTQTDHIECLDASTQVVTPWLSSTKDAFTQTQQTTTPQEGTAMLERDAEEVNDIMDVDGAATGALVRDAQQLPACAKVSAENNNLCEGPRTAPELGERGDNEIPVSGKKDLLRS